MGRQKLGEVTRTNPFFVPPFCRMKTWGKSKAFSSASNATRAFLVASSSHVLFVKPLQTTIFLAENLMKMKAPEIP